MTNELDKRLHAYRDDLADMELRNEVKATHYVEGNPAIVVSAIADILHSPNDASALNTQILLGHEVKVFERAKGWAWIQRIHDGYVGYILESDLGESTNEPSHMVLAPLTFLYPGPDLKFPRTNEISMGSKLTVVDQASTRGTDYFILDSGEAVIANHVMKLGEWKPDPVSVAETLLHTPYLWGGDSGFGIDCSGLINISNMLCGKSTLRDSDMLSTTHGKELDTDFSNLQRGDVVFWKGHCGLMMDGTNLLHANGNTMNVAIENLEAAIARIGFLYGQPTLVRRP